jgi:hypothetical protein
VLTLPIDPGGYVPHVLLFLVEEQKFKINKNKNSK